MGIADIAQISSDATRPDHYEESKIDPKYLVTLTVNDEISGYNISFSTSVDETLALSMSSQWAAPFENAMGDAASSALGAMGTAGKIASGGLQLAGKAFGLQARMKGLSAQIWQSSSPMELTIPFTFVAENSAKDDVHLKVRELLKLCAPSQSNRFMLSAPGPVMLDPTSGAHGGRKISVKIGSYLLLTPCVVKSAQVQYDNVIGEEGIPMRAKVTVEVSSWYSMFTTQDIDSMFASQAPAEQSA